MRLKPGTTVEVLQHLDGTLSGRVNGKVYGLVPFLKALPTAADPSVEKKPSKSSGVKPAANHPWRQAAAAQRARKEAGLV